MCSFIVRIGVLKVICENSKLFWEVAKLHRKKMTFLSENDRFWCI